MIENSIPLKTKLIGKKHKAPFISASKRVIKTFAVAKNNEQTNQKKATVLISALVMRVGVANCSNIVEKPNVYIQ